ncbi:MAG TPA: 50S ribosomal protein L23 [Sulfurovum sp.]|jgi:large subunit ribosomal protein L23|nr:MAG: 50S ribosomal protein L23 [Sulfurovum sp. 35-42-20]OYY54531.1 MAG: 50S ribosomal protein L23 [Sulfurovum sp. 28-43-6]OYZ24441.1 MAG: 50S ribosomal protein L23 [Sulfurovum sp. 16-42-52]OYZ48360.1 MAG: 50S ribosomal protein L23 [Sulfurovum sp. 24-42-9]OZA44246.1 MAG: 50S ribosomal protein L23 [Sulfurovum sp. 17-42-90]OZA61197.1 MAG: 50S ribosomal protein L23 [Sulfurovum sp. 39-42-12]HQR73019.1 50S ribosomal protein L23 [Sulfurovum sp.]
MADITDIKSIMYTEKSLALQEDGIIVVQTTPKMTKNGLKEVFKEFFGINPLRVNSMRVDGKVKRFKGVAGKRPNLKKFYVKLPEDAKIESLAV